MQVITASDRLMVIRSKDQPDKATAISFPVEGTLAEYQLRLRVAFETLESALETDRSC